MHCVSYHILLFFIINVTPYYSQLSLVFPITGIPYSSIIFLSYRIIPSMRYDTYYSLLLHVIPAISNQSCFSYYSMLTALLLFNVRPIIQYSYYSVLFQTFPILPYYPLQFRVVPIIHDAPIIPCDTYCFLFHAIPTIPNHSYYYLLCSLYPISVIPNCPCCSYYGLEQIFFIIRIIPYDSYPTIP